MFKCIVCTNYSLSLICKNCQAKLLAPSISSRILSSKLKVYSFYKYSEISKLLHTKHTYHGSKIYNILASNSFSKFSKKFNHDKKVYSIAIDDKTTSNYSHTAILSKALKSKTIKPIYNALKAKNNISYSKKSLDFRLKNPRDFKYNFSSNIDVILVDDIITTGTTILEAQRVLKEYNVNVLFALTIADARL